ncbi:hypothetical protein Golob_027090 [Gossypium lobatum]|uniref:Uncharacterized protein n=1 Tax=Gossypium lobatum TaxID=34289 RepID=A0A7J8LX73_9ROSI|nr:hypothetical protein [Gossypium lobatum]
MKVFEINGNTLSLTLFIDVTNSKELKESMQAGKLDPEISFLNASLIFRRIPDVFPVLVAACKALSPVHSEFVYSYLITESLKRGGVSDDSSYDLMLLVMRWYSVKKLIDGKEIGLEELEGRADQAQILKQDKIFGPELGISTIEDAIICRVAAQDAL